MIGIIVPGNKKYTPYIQNYIEVLNRKHCDYRIMSWNKTGIQEDGIDFSFNYTVRDSDRKRMLLGYLRFISACKKYIRDNKIDKLIILTAAPAFFLGLHYLSKIKNNILLDIRDDSPFIRKFPNQFKKICGMAKSVIVSSNEFSSWTGRSTVLCHNVDLEQLRIHIDDTPTNKVEMPIRIVFAGVMIEEQCNVEVLKAFKEDCRFSHFFIGRDCTGKSVIKKFTEEEHMANVFFEGAYNKDEIIDIYREKADLINIFRAKTTVNRNALPNKLYEAVLSGKPIVVFEHNKAVAQYASDYYLGIVIPEELNTSINDYLYNQTGVFDFDKYRFQRKMFLNHVIEDMNNFKYTIEDFSSEQL